MFKVKKLRKKYEAQALAIAMVILVVSSLIGMSIYSRSIKDKDLVFEERVSAEALEVTDLIIDKLTGFPISTLIQKIEELPGSSSFNYVDGVVFKEKDFQGDKKSDITEIFRGLEIINEDTTISQLIDPLCPITGTTNEYQVTLKQADTDTYYEIKPGSVWRLSFDNLIKQNSCILNMKLAIRGDTRAGFVLTKNYCNYDEITGKTIGCKDYEYSEDPLSDDILNYCFSDDGEKCNNENFLDQDNWIPYNPNSINGAEFLNYDIPRGETEEENNEVVYESLYLGTGADGSCTVSSSRDINTKSCVGRANGDAVNFTVTSNVSAGATSVTLSSTTTGLLIGDEILIINLQGTSGDNSHVGEYDMAYISNIVGNVLTLDRSLVNGYDGVTQKIMVQRVPQYTNVTVNGGVNWYPSVWNGTKGGVLAFRATGTITINGTIHANASGYRGGVGSPSETGKSGAGEGAFITAGDSGKGGPSGVVGFFGSYSGGGGGGSDKAGGAGSTISGSMGGGGGGSVAPRCSLNDCRSTAGGGGGGGYGTGGGGGGGAVGVTGTTVSSGAGGHGILHWCSMGYCKRWTAGGGGGGRIVGDTALENLLMGGGGGGGGSSKGDLATAGGKGGGIIYLIGNDISVNGTISSKGEDTGAPVKYSGAGGSGSGGSIKLVGNKLDIGSSKVVAIGGVPSARGGQGGNGRIRLEYVSSLSGTSSPASSEYKILLENLPEEPAPTDPEDKYQLSEIRIKAIGGTIGVSYNLPEDCVTGLRMYQLRATANCSGVYRGKEVLIPEAKWHNTVFDYILFNGNGSI